jgi:hypothetical protein
MAVCYCKLTNIAAFLSSPTFDIAGSPNSAIIVTYIWFRMFASNSVYVTVNVNKPEITPNYRYR